MSLRIINRDGLSLIELLAALTLSAMIMAMLLGLVARLSLARDILKEQKPFEPWKTVLVQQLQNDYVGCRSVLVGSKQITIDGYSEFKDVNGIWKNGPSRIEYRIVSDEKGHWLFRDQRSLLETPPDDLNRELVCRSILSFRSLDPLSTDVAPGTLRIELTQMISDSIPESSDGEEFEKRFRIVLVRHGVGQ